MKKSKSKEAICKEILQKIIQTAMIHEAVSAQTLQRVFPRKKSPEQEKIDKLLQRYHNEFPMGCMKGSSTLHQKYAFRWLALKHS